MDKAEVNALKSYAVKFLFSDSTLAIDGNETAQSGVGDAGGAANSRFDLNEDNEQNNEAPFSAGVKEHWVQVEYVYL